MKPWSYLPLEADAFKNLDQKNLMNWTVSILADKQGHSLQFHARGERLVHLVQVPALVAFAGVRTVFIQHLILQNCQEPDGWWWGASLGNTKGHLHPPTQVMVTTTLNREKANGTTRAHIARSLPSIFLVFTLIPNYNCPQIASS